ncbi:unnamed protein product [Rotaria sordida]|uniref:Uncharacterized protein n=1 Tax=Rotaria sordida TaxID=392033 RepID=A0A820CBR8_9BILA|nr:unnamed protein product [Rotaria sordida]
MGLVCSKPLVCIEFKQDYQLHIYDRKLDQVEDFSINLCKLHEIVFILATQTFILNSISKTCRLLMKLNHQITYPKNDYYIHKIIHLFE